MKKKMLIIIFSLFLMVAGIVTGNLNKNNNESNPIIIVNETDTFYPSDDCFIVYRDPNENCNYDYLTLRNEKDGYWALNSLIRFDISSIPSGAIIHSANFWLYYYEYLDLNPSGNIINAYVITEEWFEDTVTWNTQPDTISLPSAHDSVPGSTGNWMNWDITIDVRNFTSGSNDNYGWMLKDDTFTSSSMPISRFYAKEYGPYTPYLEIVYTLYNAPPSKPTQPAGPEIIITDQIGDYETYSTDFENDQIKYGWDWNGDFDVDEWTSFYDPGENISTSHSWSTPGTFYISVKAEDINGKRSSFSDQLKVIVFIKDKPVKPSTPTGRVNLSVGETGHYYSSTWDPEEDMIRYGWDWNGDFVVDEWTDYYESGESVSISHSWNESGSYYVRVKAKDMNNYQSEFSDPLIVIINRENNPPYTPEIISDDTDLLVNVPGNYSVYGIDPEEDYIKFGWDWNGDDIINECDWTTYYYSFQTVTINHSWNIPGLYKVKVMGEDHYGAQSDFSESFLVFVSSEQNNPPDAPSISGAINGDSGVSYMYTVISIDPDGDQLLYMIDWGDGEITEWQGPFNSGDSQGFSHIWESDGEYIIKVKSKDIYGLESDWTYLEVTMPYIHPFINLIENSRIFEILHFLFSFIF